MAKTKQHTYQLLNLSYLGTAFMVKGERVGVQFEGGFVTPFRYNGVFSTTNPDLIKVMEADPDFNTIYKRISPLTDEVDNTEDKGNVPEPPKGEGETPEDLTGYKLVEGVASCQKAKAWLLANVPEIKTAMLPNTEKVLEVAELYKIRFTDWTPAPAN